MVLDLCSSPRGRNRRGVDGYACVKMSACKSTNECGHPDAGGHSLTRRGNVRGVEFLGFRDFLLERIEDVIESV